MTLFFGSKNCAADLTRSAQALGEALRNGGLAQIVRIAGSDEHQAWKIFVKYGDKTLSFTDCTSCPTAAPGRKEL